MRKEEIEPQNWEDLMATVILTNGEWNELVSSLYRYCDFCRERAERWEQRAAEAEGGSSRYKALATKAERWRGESRKMETIRERIAEQY